uniref:hypothetical protein n=1 Tax=Pararhizobium sp. IMCC3301 TaxID=3067904 RepID=UPI0027422929|nr:hypothetical protein [Pararhizobium sp. IMCC3301]
MAHATRAKSILLATLFAGVSAAALAQPVEFTTIDINGDGVLSMEEVQTLLPNLADEDLFAADVNADGVLDEAEYQILTDG